MTSPGAWSKKEPVREVAQSTYPPRPALPLNSGRAAWISAAMWSHQAPEKPASAGNPDHFKNIFKVHSILHQGFSDGEIRLEDSLPMAEAARVKLEVSLALVKAKTAGRGATGKT